LCRSVDIRAGESYPGPDIGQPERRSNHIKTLSLSEAKMKLSALVEAVQAADEDIIITKNGSPAAVLISMEEFESLKETEAVLSDRALMEEIRTGLRSLEEDRAQLYTLEELLG
jgi:antitoxin YefM